MLLAKVAARRTGRGVTVAAALLFANTAARASEPTTADCLAASDASLEAGNERRLRDERAQLRVCASASCPEEVRSECARRVAEVTAQIPTIAFSAKDASGRDRSAVRVAIDGELLTERLEGVALSIDPGEHIFVFETAGELPVTRKLVVLQGQKDRQEVVVFGAQPQVSRVEPPAREPTPMPSPQDRLHAGLGAQRVVSLVVGGIGVVSLGVGALFGATAIAKRNDAESACPDRCATQDAADKWKAAAAAGDASTIGFVVGGAGIVAAAFLWWAVPTGGAARSVHVGLGPGALQVRGTW
jgi:hypothetical protein